MFMLIQRKRKRHFGHDMQQSEFFITIFSHDATDFAGHLTLLSLQSFFDLEGYTQEKQNFRKDRHGRHSASYSATLQVLGAANKRHARSLMNDKTSSHPGVLWYPLG
jgi:hypothetical protein